jgi:hypothetical protein
LGFAPAAGAGGKLRLDENAGRAAADFSRSPGFFHSLPGGLVPLLSLLGGFVPSLVAAAGLTPRSWCGRGAGSGLRGAEKLTGAGSVICAGLGTADSPNSGKPPSRK